MRRKQASIASTRFGRRQQRSDVVVGEVKRHEPGFSLGGSDSCVLDT
jgi:hypothetical protein